MDLWFAAKDTISKTYHAAFKNIFREEVEARRGDFEKAGITYQYMLIDDAVARVVRHEGGFLWACRNYDGDLFSDMLASGFGSLGLDDLGAGLTRRVLRVRSRSRHRAAPLLPRTSAASPRPPIRPPRSSPGPARSPSVASSTARRALTAFAHAVESAVIETIESGTVTKDLAAIAEPRPGGHVRTEGFIDAVAERLRARIGSPPASDSPELLAPPQMEARRGLGWELSQRGARIGERIRLGPGRTVVVGGRSPSREP